MILYLSAGLEKKFLSALDFDVIAGARINTLYQMSRSGYPDISLWVQTDDRGESTSVITQYGGSIYISASPDANLSELTNFIRFTGGGGHVGAPPFVFEQLECTSVFSYYDLMRYDRGSGLQYDVSTLKTPKLDDVYLLLCLADKEFAGEINRESWYVHTSHLLRHNMGFQAGIHHAGRLVSTGGVYSMNLRNAVISDIATLPDYRKKGYAAQIVDCLVGFILDSGRTPFLLAANKELIPWYESMGFAICSKWCEGMLDINLR